MTCQRKKKKVCESWRTEGSRWYMMRLNKQPGPDLIGLCRPSRRFGYYLKSYGNPTKDGYFRLAIDTIYLGS